MSEADARRGGTAPLWRSRTACATSVARFETTWRRTCSEPSFVRNCGWTREFALRTLRRSPLFAVVAVLTIGARHRREHRDLQRDRRRAAALAPLSVRRPHGVDLEQQLARRARQDGGRGAGVLRPQGSASRARRRGRHHAPDRRPSSADGGEPERAHGVRRHAEHLRSARDDAGDRTSVRRRRRNAGGAARHRPQSCALDATVRRRSENPRAYGHRRRICHAPSSA